MSKELNRHFETVGMLNLSAFENGLMMFGFFVDIRDLNRLEPFTKMICSSLQTQVDQKELDFIIKRTADVLCKSELRQEKEFWEKVMEQVELNKEGKLDKR